MESGVFCLIDHTHPAAAKLFQNLVVRDGLANHAAGCSGKYGRGAAKVKSTNGLILPLNTVLPREIEPLKVSGGNSDMAGDPESQQDSFSNFPM
jgi:hypothetical protein